jgi:hypothetical protein
VSEFIIRVHDEAFAVVPMRISDKYCSPFAINGCETVPMTNRSG